MFIYEAASLLKNVICPHCKSEVQLCKKCPFVLFDALELNNGCSSEKCTSFYKNMKVQFMSFESGQIQESELQSWLDSFKRNNVYQSQ